jgi:23S rRNA (adenine2503-C2)-methyltransferase
MSHSSLIGLQPRELEELAVALGASRYRGRQLATWMYRKGVVDPDAMTDLPRDFRERLAETHELVVPEIQRETPSQDGSRKLVLSIGRITLVQIALKADEPPGLW